MVTPLVQNKKLTLKESGDWIAIQVCWLYDNIVETFAKFVNVPSLSQFFRLKIDDGKTVSGVSFGC